MAEPSADWSCLQIAHSISRNWLRTTPFGRPLLSQFNCTALIQTYDVERVLANIEADDGNRAIEILIHGVLAPGQLRSLAGQEHGRTISFADMWTAATSQHPDGEKPLQAVSAQTLARWLGMSPKVVYDLTKAGVLEHGAGRLYPLEDSVRRYCDHIRRERS
jgi:hypothetical protein